MLTANLKFREPKKSFFFSFFAMFYIKNNNSYSRSKYLRALFAENKHVQLNINKISFVTNGGKLKLYTVVNGLIFPTPTQPRISFERPI
jgi:hypothetical protein